MLYVKLNSVSVGEWEADRVENFNIVLNCVDEDHQFHLFKEMIASYDNDMEWSCERSSNGFREYKNREHQNEFLAILLGCDDNPHWEPDTFQ